MMLLGTIWERYFLKEVIKFFSFFLGCFYGLYVLIDYASHTSALASHHIQIGWQEIGKYYLFIFASRAEILIPLAFLVALIKTLCQLNVHYELVAFMASGIKLRTLLRPFASIALLLTLLLFINEQFWMPTALKRLRRIEDGTKHQKHRHLLSMAVRHLILEDGTVFIYQSYDSALERFFDAYWIRSIDDVYRMKYLSPYGEVPIGYFVDRLIRQPNGVFTTQASSEQMPIPDLHFNHEILLSALMEPDGLSLTELWEQLPSLSQEELPEKETKILTAFYWKLSIPWLSFIAFLAVTPFCLIFSRQLPIFFIYVCGIFGLLALYLLLDAAQVIAKRQVLAAEWALGLPFLVISAFCGWRFIKKVP